MSSPIKKLPIRGVSHFRSAAHVFAPVKVAALEGVDKGFGGGNIGRNGNVVYIAESEQVDVVRLVGFRVQRIAEEYQQVDLVSGNAGSKLLIAAL